MEKKRVIVCINRRYAAHAPSCAARGSEAIADALERAIRVETLPLQLERIRCLGCCDEGPNLRLAPGGELYHQVSLSDLPDLLNAIRCFAYAEPAKEM